MRPSPAFRWILGALIVGAVVTLLGWALVAGRAEMERERELERPVKPPNRISRSAAGDVVVTIDAEGQARMGLKVEPLEARSVPREKTGQARILEFDSLVDFQDEIASAEAQLTAARAEHQRAKDLYESVKGVAHSSVEAAAAALATRENHALAAARRLANQWGEGIASLSPLERESLVDRLVKRKAAVARVDLPVGESIPDRPAGAAIASLASRGPRLKADRVFDAPQVDPKLQGASFLLVFESVTTAFRPGAVMAGYIEYAGDGRDGVLIPSSAVIRLEGLSWVYVRGAPDKFFRRDVSLDHLLGEGWFTAQGFTAGDQVVVAGAEALLSEELRYRIQLEEE